MTEEHASAQGAPAARAGLTLEGLGAFSARRRRVGVKVARRPAIHAELHRSTCGAYRVDNEELLLLCVDLLLIATVPLAGGLSAV